MISSSLLLEKTTNPEISLTTINTEESFFISGLNFLKEINYEFDNANKILYYSISESSNDYEVITESFSGFTETVKKIITKFLEFIKSVFKRFVTQLHKIVGSEKYILKHQDEFKNFTVEHEFDMDIFTFTISDDMPQLSAYNDYISDIENLDNNFNNLKSELQKDNNIKPEDYTNHILKQIYTDTVNIHDEYWYDAFRGKVLNKGVPISKTDYGTELFEVFRNGESVKENKRIDLSLVTQSLNTFKNYEKATSAVERNRRHLEKEYKDIKDNISKIKGDQIQDTNIKLTNQDEKIQAEQFFKAKANQIQNMCNIHTLAFTAKLDAIKEQYKQDKSILYKALNKVYKKGDK